MYGLGMGSELFLRYKDFKNWLGLGMSLSSSVISNLKLSCKTIYESHHIKIRHEWLVKNSRDVISAVFGTPVGQSLGPTF